jgi:hypothetical protein
MVKINNGRSLLDPSNRKQLDSFVASLLKNVGKRFDIPIEDLMQLYVCMNREKTLNSKDNILSQKNEVLLEYINIMEGEYLYDPETRDVYTFSDIPEKIGFYNNDTESVILDR